jgi:hypothetical protein
MIFRSTSIQSVIARVIRNTRVQDSSYLIDMMEWIPEAMGKMQTQQQLKRTFQDVEVAFHKGKLPCDLVDLLAVEYKGQRLRTGNSVKNITTGHNIKDGMIQTPDLFTTVIATQNQKEFTSEQNHIWGSTLTPAEPLTVNCDVQGSDYYEIEMEYINTSFSDGIVRLHYDALPVDAQGMPLIPDNENYKEAIYWYCRARMIGCGYNDTVFNEKDLMQRFELYATRAISEITYPSPDVMESRINTLVRFIPPANYWENFFRNDSPERLYNK